MLTPRTVAFRCARETMKPVGNTNEWTGGHIEVVEASVAFNLDECQLCGVEI